MQSINNIKKENTVCRKRHHLSGTLLRSFLFCVLLPASTVFAQQSEKQTADKNVIIATEQQVWEGFKTKDVKSFEANVSDDSVMIGYIGVFGKADGLKLVANSPCEVKGYTLTNFKVTFFNSGTALLTYKGATEGTCLGRAVPTVWASAIYVKRGGRWLKASHQETPTK